MIYNKSNSSLAYWKIVKERIEGDANEKAVLAFL